MVKYQVNVEMLAVYGDALLPPHEEEIAARLQHKVLQAVGQGLFQVVFLVSSLVTLVCSMFGGLWGALSSLAVHYGLIFKPGDGFSIVWICPVILAFAGGLVNLVFWRLYQTQQELEHMAVRDALAGLYNRFALEAGFACY